jgi:alpha-ketoglutarate-dependent 2,4-dichlorophenoxyacetate dioxygenase
MEIKPVDPVNRAFFAGVVSGVDLSKPLSAAEVAAVHAGMDKFGVLVFHGQPISDDQQLVFSRALGRSSWRRAISPRRRTGA